MFGSYPSTYTDFEMFLLSHQRVHADSLLLLSSSPTKVPHMARKLNEIFTLAVIDVMAFLFVLLLIRHTSLTIWYLFLLKILPVPIGIFLNRKHMHKVCWTIMMYFVETPTCFPQLTICNGDIVLSPKSIMNVSFKFGVQMIFAINILVYVLIWHMLGLSNFDVYAVHREKSGMLCALSYHLDVRLHLAFVVQLVL